MTRVLVWITSIRKRTARIASRITEMGKSSPVQIEVRSLGENQLMLHNKRNHKHVRLDYVSTKELLFIESSAGKRYSVPLRQPWDEVATKVLLEITGNR